MRDICQKFLKEINRKIDDFYFLYDGNLINFNLTFNQQIKEIDKNSCEMTIIAFPYKSTNYNPNKY